MSNGNTSNKFRIILSVLVATLLVVVVGWKFFYSTVADSKVAPALRVSVPPFVDTAITVVGVRDGLFATRGLNIKLVDTNWENQYELLVGGALDVSMSTLDEFVNKDRNLRALGKPVVYVLPAWQFRGLAFYSTNDVKPLSEFQKAYPADQAKKAFLAQIKEKKLVIPEGSVFEQALRAFVADSDLTFKDLKIINASLDSALNSLGDRSVGLAAVGSQQRFEAERRGYREAISPEDLGLDVITGFVVPKTVWESRKQDVINFACAWYGTTRVATAQEDHAYDVTNKYLVGRGSNSLTLQEYTALRAYNVLPTKAPETKSLFFDAGGKAYWKKTWDRSVKAMTDAGKTDSAPQDSAGFVAPEFNALLATSCQNE